MKTLITTNSLIFSECPGRQKCGNNHVYFIMFTQQHKVITKYSKTKALNNHYSQEYSYTHPTAMGQYIKKADGGKCTVDKCQSRLSFQNKIYHLFGWWAAPL